MAKTYGNYYVNRVVGDEQTRLGEFVDIEEAEACAEAEVERMKQNGDIHMVVILQKSYFGGVAMIKGYNAEEVRRAYIAKHE